MSEPTIKGLYEKARLRGEMPEGGWPESFGVVTAWNPEGKVISGEERLGISNIERPTSNVEVKRAIRLGGSGSSWRFSGWRMGGSGWCFCEPGGSGGEVAAVGEMLG